MKNLKFKILLIALILFQYSFSQEKIYFNDTWKVTDKENASYYRIVTKKSDSLFYIKDYYINDTLQMDGHFTNLKKEVFHGTLNWYGNNGKKTITRNYNKGTLEGETINYSKDGSVFSKGIYKAGKPYNGLLINYSSPISFDNYKNGEKVSVITFYKDRKQKATEKFFFIKSVKNKVYYPLIEVYYDKNNAIIDTLYYSKKYDYMIDRGVKISFHKEEEQVTSIKSKQVYKDGLENGDVIIYHKNGEIWLEGIFKKGKKHNGFFLENFKQSQYKNGIQVGEQIKYDKDFNVLSKVSYKNGKPYGGVIYNYQETLTYREGALINKTKYYDYKHQNLKKISNYKDNESAIEWYGKQGNLLGAGTTRDDKPFNGLHADYNVISLYKEARKHGIEKEYETKDFKQLLVETFYKNGSVVWKKTFMPLKGKFLYCDYKDNNPFNGVDFKYSTEKYYENSKLIKKVTYRKNYKTKELTLDLISFYDSKTKYRTVIKEIFYRKGTPYTITYKNYTPQNGVLWRGLDSFETYKDGKREGLYRIFKDDVVIEEGNYVNDQIHGAVTYTPVKDKYRPMLDVSPTSCEFDKGKPVNGTVSNQQGITTYINGKKHQKQITYYYANNDFTIKKVTYKNGIKDGKVTVTIGDKRIIEGVYKDDKPYSGSFYNLKTRETENYLEYKKHGLFTTIHDGLIKQTQKYDTGNLLLEKTILINNDSILGEGIYKNSKAYTGQFIKKLETHNQYLIEPYRKGKKHGVERQINLKYNNSITQLRFTTYKKDKKQGAYQYLMPKYTSLVKEIKGIYKNDNPYDGVFLTKEEKKFQVLSKYKAGKKEGYEKYIYNKVDSLLYKNGEIIEGVQLEYIKEKYSFRVLRHYYTAGIRTKIKLQRGGSIVFTKEGFEIHSDIIDSKNFRVEVVFNNSQETAGIVKYFQNKKPMGSLQFENGKLLSGQLKMDINDGRRIEAMLIEVKGDTVEMILNLYKEFDMYNEVTILNKIPKKISYKDYALLMNGFVDVQNPIKKVTIKQYLLDGTLIATSEIRDAKKTGVLIDFYKEKEGKPKYTIRYYKKGQKKEDTIKIDNLNLTELLEALKKLKK